MVSLLSVVIAIAALGAASAQTVAVDQNSWAFMLRRFNGQTCAEKYAEIIENPYYANDATCKTEVKKAMETYIKADCPNTQAPGTVWKCMSGWNGTVVDQGRIDAWISFLTNCEVLYIAQRVNTAESEDGFQWRDNSCFTRYKSMGEFVSYLRSSTADGGSAGSIFVSTFHVVLAVALALFMLR